jgi:hypothetical protein
MNIAMYNFTQLLNEPNKILHYTHLLPSLVFFLNGEDRKTEGRNVVGGPGSTCNDFVEREHIPLQLEMVNYLLKVETLETDDGGNKKEGGIVPASLLIFCLFFETMSTFNLCRPLSDDDFVSQGY